MSKALGNYFTLRDLPGKGFTGREVRQLLLSAHYRETFNFTLDGLTGAKTALARIDECVAKLRDRAGSNVAEPDRELVAAFEAALDDDLNISAAWGAVFKWVSQTNRVLADNSLTVAGAAAALAAWEKVNAVLGIGLAAEAEAPPELTALIAERQQARQAKDFKRSDAIRDELKAKGWVIEDSPKGQRLKKL